MTTIAQTIIYQIIEQDLNALPAWGVNEVVDLHNGVQFDIRTPLYPEGVKVKIILNWMDTYDIEVIKVTGTKAETLKTANDVYFDMLIEVLDKLIEEDKKTIILF
ncbi:hypothetical protein [Bacillus xiapuensis]|uniref:Uncharacterized protein n=1 Tax=Bacillus xiapuensis TaxID=2014075 RepID=A0ABU6NGC9_9BACI|nr:hypothetical protein [Bacillus xiapuensis]